MRDPYTLAFSVRLPLVGDLIDIWHKDPGGYGNDDSCGYSFVRLTEKQRKRIRDVAWWESKYPYFMRSASEKWHGTRGEAETLYRALVLWTARALGLRISYDDACKFAALRIHDGTCEDVSRHLCWLPGYHCNGADSAEKRHDHFAGVMGTIARQLLTERRRWWQAPRWHIHHWRLQFTFLRRFKRNQRGKASS